MKPAIHDEILIARIPTGPRNELRITRVRCDIRLREWFRPLADGAEMRPGREGLTLRVGQLDALLAALAKAVRS